MSSSIAFKTRPSLRERAERQPARSLEWQQGHEPPMAFGVPHAAREARRPSLRWLGASVLTGLAGALLLGAAIYVSSQGQVRFADLAERAQPGAGRPGDAAANALRKGDKLVRAETVAAAKQTFKAPMTIRTGDRESIRIRTFTRIATNLSLTSGVYAIGIPAFNPMRFFAADTDTRVATEAPPEPSEVEVTVVKADLSAIVLEPNGPVLSEAEVVAQVASQAGVPSGAGGSALLPLPTVPRGVPGASLGGIGNAFLPARGDGAFRSIEVRVVPENVTDFAKAAVQPGAEAGYEEATIAIRRGETLDAMLRANGASADEARQMVLALGGRDRQTPSLEGMQARLLLGPPSRPGGPRTPARVILFGERGIEAIGARNDRGAYVSVSLPQAEAPKAAPRRGDADEDDEEGSGARLYDSLYETALKHNLSRQTVEDLIRIFGYDVDFQRRVAPGDGFELFFATDDDAPGDRLEVLSATLRLGSDVKRVFRYQGDDGTVDWFDEQGRSLKKFLLRKPIVDGKLTSGFGVRFHPILGYAKGHTGVDWANKTGTPIFAAGNGTIIKAEWSSGYGRRIEIQHANGYVTTYNHQSAFARGIGPGVRVRQGQVIGYVGSTGLSTGAHLHYEVVVNGHFVDPMKIRVPRGRELDGTALANFRRQREQIEGLMNRASTQNRFAGALEPR